MSFTLNFHFIYLKNHNISVFSITNSLSVRLNFSKHNSEIRYSILMGTIWPWQISPINMQPTSALNNYAGLAAVLQLVLQLVSWTSWQHQAVHRGGSRYIGPTLMSSTKSWYEAVPSSVWTSCWTHISVVSGYYGLVVAWCWRYRSCTLQFYFADHSETQSVRRHQVLEHRLQLCRRRRLLKEAYCRWPIDQTGAAYTLCVRQCSSSLLQYYMMTAQPG